MIIILRIAGCILIALATIHFIFPRYFGWRDELKRLRLVNRQMMEVHTFFIALTVGLMGLLCILSTEELISTGLGKTVCAGFAIFWAARLVVQFAWYSPELWRNKRFETSVHVVFSVLWTGLTALFTFLATRSLPDAP